MLGSYELLFRLASGGMAQVHVACRRGEGGFVRPVAVKRMLDHLASDPEFVDMFLDEARLAASIHSPHVVQTIDVGRDDDDSLFLVMELVVGVALSDLLGDTLRAGATIPVDVAVEIVAQAAEGLHDAHEARSPAGAPLAIVHRDVSPQNILIGKDGRVRVNDFGVARALHRRTRTITGQLKGKFAYFSPEQALGGPLDRRSDIFGLGVVAWELLATDRLFSAPEGAAGVLEEVKSKLIPRLDDVRRDVPVGIAEVVARAVDRDPAARYPTAAEFAAALRLAAVQSAAGRSVGGESRAPEIERYVASVSGARIRRLEQRIEAALAALPAHGSPTVIDAFAPTQTSESVVPDDAPAKVRPPVAPRTRSQRRTLALAAGIGLIAALVVGAPMLVYSAFAPRDVSPATGTSPESLSSALASPLPSSPASPVPSDAMAGAPPAEVTTGPTETGPSEAGATGTGLTEIGPSEAGATDGPSPAAESPETTPRQARTTSRPRTRPRARAESSAPRSSVMAERRSTRHVADDGELVSPW
jgi:serine/threonine-protein kinase